MRSSQLFAVVVALLPALSAAVPAGTSSRASSLKAASSKAASSKAASTRAASTSKSVAAAAAGASAVPPVGSNGTTGTIQVSDTQIANAVASWMTDTGKVTKFLDTATSFTGDEFTRQATIALNAEKDELNHKNILDAAMGMQPDVQAANNVLEMQGTFQMVVDTLQKMVSQGPDTAQADVDSINKNRCVNVLPNIDKYFAAAGSSTFSASRPTGCLEITSSSAGTAAASATTTNPAAAASVTSGTSTAAGSGAAASVSPSATTPKSTSVGAAASASSGTSTAAGSGAAASVSPSTTTPKSTSAGAAVASSGAVSVTSSKSVAAAKATATAKATTAKKLIAIRNNKVMKTVKF